jgi:hypothetical protein
VKQLSRASDETRAAPVGLEAVVSDADKAGWEDVLEESLDEVRRVEGEKLLEATLSIAMTKGDAPLGEGHQPLVADGDAMGIATQISEHLRRTCHGRLAVDHPLPGRRLA